MEKTICDVHHEGEITVVRVTENKLYQNVVAPFQNTIVSLLDDGKKNLIINLTEVDVMNSSSLGVLILAWDRLSKDNGKLVIAGLCPLLDELFQRMKLDLLFQIAKTEDEAILLLCRDKKIPAN
jgi:anti-anti-sigma factor